MKKLVTALCALVFLSSAVKAVDFMLQVQRAVFRSLYRTRDHYVPAASAGNQNSGSQKHNRKYPYHLYYFNCIFYHKKYAVYAAE